MCCSIYYRIRFIEGYHRRCKGNSTIKESIVQIVKTPEFKKESRNVSRQLIKQKKLAQWRDNRSESVKEMEGKCGQGVIMDLNIF
jgi:hypothetical protein